MTVDPDGVPDSGDEFSAYRSDFDELEGFLELGFSAGPFPVSVFGDFVRNTEADEDNTAYLVGGKLGKAKRPGSWEALYSYRRVEKDAVVGAFCDSDFIGGGTNGKGHTLGLSIAASENATLGVTYFVSQSNLGNEKDYRRLQVDFASAWK